MDALEQLQDRITGYLGQVNALRFTPVILARPRRTADGTEITAPQIQQAINDALAGTTMKNGKAGTCISVLMPEENVVNHQDFEGQIATTVSLSVRVVENLAMNTTPGFGTFLSCEVLADTVMMNLHGLWAGPIFLKSDESRGKYPVLVKDDDNLLVYELLFKGETSRLCAPRVTPVKATIAAGDLPRNVTLGCATEGAVIWYTLDGSFPAPDNANATQYAGTFAVAEASTLSAVAYLGGLSPSNLLHRLIT